MRTVVFGDVHGNLPALEAMLAHAGRADRYVCVGDVVNYGPWSNECVDLIASIPNCDCLMGNHDAAFLNGRYDGKHPLVQAFFAHCYPHFTRHAPLRSYQESTAVGGFQVRHTLNDAYIFPDSDVQIDDNYIIGHSHHQFFREIGGRLLVNAGSVGQNRKFINVICYLQCGPGDTDVKMQSFAYDVSPVINRMADCGYPAECIAYYMNKPRA